MNNIQDALVLHSKTFVQIKNDSRIEKLRIKFINHIFLSHFLVNIFEY